MRVNPSWRPFTPPSAGVTAKSSDAWVSDRPYLVSVESPENADSVPNYYSVTPSLRGIPEKILAAEPTAVLEGSPEGWVTDLQTNSSNRVESVTVGGVSLPGYGGAQHPGPALGLLHGEVRGRWHYLPCDRLWPRSRHEPVRGQCPGREGKTWREILQWYYRGVSIESWEKHDIILEFTKCLGKGTLSRYNIIENGLSKKPRRVCRPQAAKH